MIKLNRSIADAHSAKYNRRNLYGEYLGIAVGKNANAFDVVSLGIPNLKLFKPQIFKKDERGLFIELYKYSDFSRAGIGEHLIQDNYSKSVKGVLRGLHYQKNPKAQGKLVFCIKGHDSSRFGDADHNFVFRDSV